MIKSLLEQEENQTPKVIKPDELKGETEKVFIVEENSFAGNAGQLDEIKFEETKAGTEIPSKEKKEETLFQTDFKSESPGETIRKSGLAYAAAVVLFASIAFMLIIGWFFDLLIGTSPWGIVGGIVLGAIIGFFQFFRLTSQIINNKK